MVFPDALTAPALLALVAAAATAQVAALLLVPGAQGLAVKSQVIVLDDCGLDPGVGAGVVVVVGLRCRSHDV